MINVTAIVLLLRTLNRMVTRSRSNVTLRVFNCPTTVRQLARADIISLKRSYRRRDTAWTHRGPEMNGGKPTLNTYTAFITPGPNFEAGLNGISVLLALFPGHDLSTRSYCDFH